MPYATLVNGRLTLRRHLQILRPPVSPHRVVSRLPARPVHAPARPSGGCVGAGSGRWSGGGGRPERFHLLCWLRMSGDGKTQPTTTQTCSVCRLRLPGAHGAGP